MRKVKSIALTIPVVGVISLEDKRWIGFKY